MALADLWRVAANNEVTANWSPDGLSLLLDSSQSLASKHNFRPKLRVSVFPELHERLVLTLRARNVAAFFMKLAKPEMRTRKAILVRPRER